MVHGTGSRSPSGSECVPLLWDMKHAMHLLTHPSFDGRNKSPLTKPLRTRPWVAEAQLPSPLVEVEEASFTSCEVTDDDDHEQQSMHEESV